MIYLLQILAMENELKRQAGENKSPESGKQSLMKTLPQVDGLASEQTQENQARALTKLLAQEKYTNLSSNYVMSTEASSPSPQLSHFKSQEGSDSNLESGYEEQSDEETTTFELHSLGEEEGFTKRRDVSLEVLAALLGMEDSSLEN